MKMRDYVFRGEDMKTDGRLLRRTVRFLLGPRFNDVCGGF